ncbi:MAG: tetratricopeptide repeat protein [Candidatus Omnitrophica bacterium]|jgi:tetratricopeptide (TPR) repeat protein|nr:tetratricopeptide repeat protein [Candidatus Omnitrophota bacterium]
MGKIKLGVSLLLILIIVFAALFPCLSNGFTSWDDNMYVTENRSIRSFSPENLKNISTSFFITHYQPVTIFSYLLEYHFFRLNPFNYHLTNLILHLLNCLLVFWMVYLFSGRILVSFITAVFFGIHPMQVESVAWISERKNLLYAFFFLGALVSYLYYQRGEKIRYYFLCLFSFILALLSKSMAVTLPLVLLAFDFFSSRKIKGVVFLEKIPFFCLSFLFGIIAVLGGHSSRTFYAFNDYGIFARLEGIAYDVIFYLGKLCFPSGLSALYPYSPIENNIFYFYSFLAFVILLVAVIISARRTKKIIFGFGFFLLTVFPALRFLPRPEALAADRYIYISAIGIFYLFAEGFAWLYRRKIKYGRFIRAGLLAILAAAIISCGAAARERSRVWRNDFSLWDDVLKKYPDVFLAYDKRGEFFLSQKEYEPARADFTKAIELSKRYPFNPEYRYFYLNLTYALRALGRQKEALAVAEGLVKEAQDYLSLSVEGNLPEAGDKVTTANRLAVESEAYFNLAQIYDAAGDKDKAMSFYLRAIEISPRNANAHFYLGVLYAGRGKGSDAREEFLKVLELDPAYQPAYIKLARIYRDLAEDDKLELLYKKAVVSGSDLFDAYLYLGNRLTDARREEEAVPLYLKALKINPVSKEACVSLGNAYLTAGKTGEAILWLKKALKLDPRLAVAHHNLALAYFYARDYNLAVEHSDRAASLGYAVSPKLKELLKPYRE